MSRYLIIIVVAGFTIHTASAQYSNKGWSIRPHFSGVAWTLDDLDIESGGGFGLGVTYGYSELIAPYLEFHGATLEAAEGGTYVLAHFDLGARFTFGQRQNPLKFTANAALSGRAAEWDAAGLTVEASGANLTLGAGVEYHLSRQIGLDFNLQTMFGSISEAKIGGVAFDVDEPATSVRANIGIVWKVGRR